MSDGCRIQISWRTCFEIGYSKLFISGESFVVKLHRRERSILYAGPS